MQQAESHASKPVHLLDRASAEAFVTRLLATMRDLEAVLARESAGVRAGHLRDALSETDRKSALASAYLNGLEAIKANAVTLTRFVPDRLDALKQAHRRFAASVETNQAVLATARTVSEGLIRTLADEIAKMGTPTVYGRPSITPSPYGRSAGRAPMVLSRSL